MKPRPSAMFSSLKNCESPETDAAGMPLTLGHEHVERDTDIQDDRAFPVSPSRSRPPPLSSRRHRSRSGSRARSPSPGQKSSRSPAPCSRNSFRSRQSRHSGSQARNCSPGQNRSRSPAPRTSLRTSVRSWQSIHSVDETRSRNPGQHSSSSPTPSFKNSFRSRQSIHTEDAGAEEQPEHPRPSSFRSRPSSLDLPAPQLKVTFTDSTNTKPKDAQPPGSSNRTIHLDREDPGDFVIRHHRDSLVVQLRDYKPGKLQSRLAGVKKKFLGARLASRRKKSEVDDKEAQREKETTAASGDNKRFRISFAEIQRMKIRKLQCVLVRHVVKMRVDGHESPGWEDTLEKYIKALQDHDYMEHRSKSARDPFLATGEYAMDDYILNCNIDNILANDPILKTGPSLRPWETHKTQDHLHNFEPICGTRRGNIAQTWYHGFKNRVLLAALGGAFLIGPMWLMVLQDGKFTGLGTTTGFVTLFGITMAYFLEEGKDVLASTAGYAAVLVVFVGTSTSSGSG